MKYLLICLIICMNLHANNRLLPGLLFPLEPAIPADFVARSPRGDQNLNDWVYWGREEVLKSYFEDPSSIKEPIIRVKLSRTTTQKGPKLELKEIKNLNLKSKNNLKEVGYFETHWGDYPVLALNYPLGGHTVQFAWVGLNDPESGGVLIFNLVNANSNGEQLWDNLITKTSVS